MKKHLIVTGITLLLFGVVLSGCTDSEQKSRAEGEIIDKHTSSNNDVDDFTIFVNLTVKNVGDAGNLKVWATIRQGTTIDEKSQTIFFESGEIKDISLAFSEGFKLGSSWVEDYGVNPPY